MKRSVPAAAVLSTTAKGQSIDYRGHKRKLLETRYNGRRPRDSGWPPDTPHDSLLCWTPLLQESCFGVQFSISALPCIPGTNERQVASRGAAGAPSEPQIDAYHGLRRVGECPSRAINRAQVRRLVQVAAVLEAQADVRQQTPIETGAVDIYHFVRRGCG